MKLLIAIMSLLFLTSCASKTEHGKCVGIMDPQDPKLQYKISTQNVIVGLVFFELIAPPVFVVMDQFYCPIGTKDVLQTSP